MVSASPIAGYLGELERALGYPRGRRARRAIREISDHLADASAGLQASGSPRIEAEREACKRLGDAGELAASLAASNVIVGELPLRLAVPLWAGLGLSMAAAALFVTMSVLVGAGSGIVALNAVALIVTVAAVASFWRLQFASGAIAGAGLAAAGLAALAMAAGGIGLALLAYVVGAGSGDFEYYLFVRAALVAATGFGGLGVVRRQMPRPA